MNFVVAAFVVFIAAFVVEGFLRGMARSFGLFTTVQEGTCRVYVLFGKVVDIVDEPGLHILPFRMGLKAFVINLLGTCHVIDLRLDQEYLRSEAVNSEEGAPMGIGIWYEMWISNPVAYLFQNTDPGGSLRANVSNSTVRCLSNMPLAEMLETRHNMSQAVRAEVSGKSQAWGYKLGSVYIRKVHFRDAGMIRQIEEKVVNRLRQVTSAIKQTGANQVSVITSSAEREAAIELAKAARIRPATLRQVFEEAASVPEVGEALLQILETQRIINGGARLMLLPAGTQGRMLGTLLAAGATGIGSLPKAIAASAGANPPPMPAR